MMVEGDAGGGWKGEDASKRWVGQSGGRMLCATNVLGFSWGVLLALGADVEGTFGAWECGLAIG
jgi:hypothetical protein